MAQRLSILATLGTATAALGACAPTGEVREDRGQPVHEGVSILLLDTDGYWQPLVALTRHVIDAGFAEETMADYYSTVPDVPTLVSALRAALS